MRSNSRVVSSRRQNELVEHPVNPGRVTQVVAVDTGHVFHNRLTHSLQVAQVGRRIAERLIHLHSSELEGSIGLDPDVVEAACMAHDLGHPPFRRIAEEKLNEPAGADID